MQYGILDLSSVSWQQPKPWICAHPISQESQATQNWVAMLDHETPACGFVAMPQHVLVHDQIQVRQRILCICLESRYESSSTANLPIPFGTERLLAILSTSVRIWDTAHLLVAMPQHLLAVDLSSDAPERLEYISIWLIYHCIIANPSGNIASLDNIEYLYQTMRHWLTDL